MPDDNDQGRKIDPLLESLVDSSDEIERERVIESLIARARDVTTRVLNTAGGVLELEDAEDIVSTVTLRLLRRLGRMGELEHISSFDDFVARLSYNAFYDFLRRRYPERTRLKNRLRYLCSRDPRFALWRASGEMIAGLARWKGRSIALYEVSLSTSSATALMLDRSSPTDALLAVFKKLGRPMKFESLVTMMAELWAVQEIEHVSGHLTASTRVEDRRLERRETLTNLWEEIKALRPLQRSALLLNLRDEESHSAVALIVLLGVATIDEIAEVLGIEPDGLAKLWPRLPISDLEIAEMFSITRQQVINLRKAARERLVRRLAVLERIVTNKRP